MPKGKGSGKKDSCPKLLASSPLRISHQPSQIEQNSTSRCNSSSQPCVNVTSHSVIQNASLFSASLGFLFACLWDSEAFIELMQTPGKFICPLISSMLMLPSISSDNQGLTLHRTVGDLKNTYHLMRVEKY